MKILLLMIIFWIKILSLKHWSVFIVILLKFTSFGLIFLLKIIVL